MKASSEDQGFSEGAVPDPARPSCEGRVLLVADRFNWPAALFPLLWAPLRAGWEATALACALFAAAIVLGLSGVGEAGFWGVLLCAMLFFGIKAPALRMGALQRRGWTRIGRVEARTAREATARWQRTHEGLPA